jgi:hypothetical protein
MNVRTRQKMFYCGIGLLYCVLPIGMVWLSILIIMNDLQNTTLGFIYSMVEILLYGITTISGVVCENPSSKVGSFNLQQVIGCADEHPGMREIKTYFLEHIESDWSLQDERLIATVLHPSFKHLDTFSEKIKRQAHQLVKNKMQYDLTTSSSSTITTTLNTTSPSSMNNSNKTGLFSSLYDKPKDVNKKKVNLKCI